jgi:spermidine/putrescine transport system permease protein
MAIMLILIILLSVAVVGALLWLVTLPFRARNRLVLEGAVQ